MITAAVKTMARRYDASVADPPLTARVRLVSGDEAHDVVLDGDGAESSRPADAATTP